MVHHSRSKPLYPRSAKSDPTSQSRPPTSRTHNAPRAKDRGSRCPREGHLYLYPLLARSRCGSGPHPPYSPSQDRNRLTLPLSHSHIPFSSTSPSAMRASVKRSTWCVWVKFNVSAADELYVHLDSLRFCRYHPCVRGFPTPRGISRSFQPSRYRVVMESSSSSSTAGYEPPTRPSSLPHNLISTDEVLPSYKYTPNVPVSLKIGPA